MQPRRRTRDEWDSRHNHEHQLSFFTHAHRQRRHVTNEHHGDERFARSRVHPKNNVPAGFRPLEMSVCGHKDGRKVYGTSRQLSAWRQLGTVVGAGRHRRWKLWSYLVLPPSVWMW